VTLESEAGDRAHYRILMTADLSHFPVPPLRYGGAERAVAVFGEALSARGHIVDLIAKHGSQRFNGELYTPPSPSDLYLSRAFCKILYQPVSLWAARHADVVHCHSRTDYPVAIYRTSKPMVIHFHNEPSQEHVSWLLRQRSRRIRLIAISRSQIEHLSQKEFFEVIHSVPPIAGFPFRETPESPPYLVYLGRVNHDKGADIAVQVSRRAGIPLRIVGPLRDEPGNQAFYREKIAPFLGPECVHLGEVTEEEKLRMLAGATALIFPIRWREPMGIVMIESLACGTPVIVSNRASAPELVSQGRTGFLCEELEDFVRAVSDIGSISRRVCRREAETRFGFPEMIRRVEGVYASVIAA
jgi:glycosyltransferase involved in cell wall biosynthesis